MAMSKQEQEAFLERWGNECLVCGKEVPDDERSIEFSIQELTVRPAHAAPFVTRYYMSCKECRDNGELI